MLTTLKSNICSTFDLFQNYFKVVSIIKPMTETTHYVVAIFWQKFWFSKCQISLNYSRKWFVKFWVVASYLVSQLFNDIFDRKFINFVFARNVFEKQSLWLPTVQKVEKIEKYFFFSWKVNKYDWPFKPILAIF